MSMIFIAIVVLGIISSMNNIGLPNMSQLAYNLMLISLGMAGAVALFSTWENNKNKKEK